jgi:hypothetical protein
MFVVSCVGCPYTIQTVAPPRKNRKSAFTFSVFSGSPDRLDGVRKEANMDEDFDDTDYSEYYGA